MSNIVNVEYINRLRPDLIIIEDNCEGFMGKYEDKLTGSSTTTLCSSISFYANKNITSGEGGAFLTNDDEIFNYISKVYSHGMTSKRYIHDIEAWNFRMTNVQAALLYPQLCNIDSIIKLKQDLFTNYQELIKNNSCFILIKTTENCISSYWMFALKIQTNKSYEEIEAYMLKNNIEIRPMFYSVSCHQHLDQYDKKLIQDNDFNNQQESNNVIVILPSSPSLTFEIQQHIIKKLTESLD
jgi:perosamine synthetase